MPLVAGQFRGEVLAGFERLARQREAASWKDVAHELGAKGVIDPRAPAEVRLVRWTTENLVKAEALVRVGSEKPQGERNWHALYKPAAAMAAEELLQVCTLTESMRAWAMARVSQEVDFVEGLHL